MISDGQKYNVIEIENNETEIFNEYIKLLEQYNTVLDSLKELESVKYYIMSNKLKDNSKYTLVNGHVLRLYNRYGQPYFKVEPI